MSEETPEQPPLDYMQPISDDSSSEVYVDPTPPADDTPADVSQDTVVYESAPESTEEFVADPTTQVVPDTDPQFIDQTDEGLPPTPEQSLTPEQRWIWVWNSDIDRGRYPGDPDAPPLPDPSPETGHWVAMSVGVPIYEE